MRHLGIDEHLMMRLARERAAEIQADWLLANGSKAGRAAVERAGSRPGLVVRIRLAAGRRLIGGTGVAARQSEPCA